jgi:hypothetical protein
MADGKDKKMQRCAVLKTGTYNLTNGSFGIGISCKVAGWFDGLLVKFYLIYNKTDKHADQ